MKGVMLALGTGSRLNPLTRVAGKHLLPHMTKPVLSYSTDQKAGRALPVVPNVAR